MKRKILGGDVIALNTTLLDSRFSLLTHDILIQARRRSDRRHIAPSNLRNMSHQNTTMTLLICMLICTTSLVTGFSDTSPLSSSSFPLHRSSFTAPKRITCQGVRSSSSKLQMNFFKDLLNDAFSNDESLPSDKSQSQLEGPGDDPDFGASISSSAPKTEVQKRWLEQQQQQQRRRESVQRSVVGGAPVDPTALHGTVWDLDLYLLGVPERDPSSDLYGSRVNISTKRENDGIPPSITVQ
eukprot:8465424-Ditylum_brightwellii.AAC.1